MAEHEMRKRYTWAGRAANPTRCDMEIQGGFDSHQCSRKRGHGPEGAYCWQHARRFEEVGDE